MSNTIYATFASPEDAEKAAGALLDHGIRPEDLSVVKRQSDGTDAITAPHATASNVVEPQEGSVYGVRESDSSEEIDGVAKHGLTTTTAGDAGAGAVKGTVIGAGVGAIAAIAALIVPGVGIVLGAGALATAIGAVAASAGTGAAAGAIVGYLKDMGVDDQVASTYGEAVEGGGAVLAVSVPSGSVDEEEANAVLRKYAATNVNHYATRASMR